jgi:regulatory protein
MLARKGYSQGMSYRVVRDELSDAGADTALIDDATLD